MAENNLDKLKQDQFSDTPRFYDHVMIRQAFIGQNIDGIRQLQEVGMEKEVAFAEETAQALGAQDGVQLMLAAQMSAVHILQQNLAVFAYNIASIDQNQEYLRSVTKLSNLFVQQASLMHKLKIVGSQTTVETVHVHNGGQAIVGTIHTTGEKT